VSTIARQTRRFHRGQDGKTTTEYAVILALFVAVVYAAAGSIGAVTSGLLRANAYQIAAVASR
jgi:Flp pilus assembly pilin Flp